MAIYLWLYWRYFVRGTGWPRSTAEARRMDARANALPPEAWGPALLAGLLGLAGVLLLQGVLSRLVALPRQRDLDVSLLELGINQGGRIPASGVACLNLPVDVVHVLAYLVAHEEHHRGQIMLLARQMGHRLPSEITAGLWQWSKRAKEAQAHRG
jgi:hypothetical protein